MRSLTWDYIEHVVYVIEVIQMLMSSQHKSHCNVKEHPLDQSEVLHGIKRRKRTVNKLFKDLVQKEAILKSRVAPRAI